MSPWPNPSFSKAKPKASLTVWGNKSFLCIKPFSDLPTLSRHMWLAPAYLWYHLHATIPFAHCVLTTLAFFLILILLPCQNYFYLLTYQNYFYLMFLLHMITSNVISWERLSFTLERSPSRMPFILYVHIITLWKYLVHLFVLTYGCSPLSESVPGAHKTLKNTLNETKVHNHLQTEKETRSHLCVGKVQSLVN